MKKAKKKKASKKVASKKKPGMELDLYVALKELRSAGIKYMRRSRTAELKSYGQAGKKADSIIKKFEKKYIK